MHFVVGFTGELGELLDAENRQHRVEELADCMIYLHDLAGILDLDLVYGPHPRSFAYAFRHWARVCNAVKKWNRDERMTVVEVGKVIMRDMDKVYSWLRSYADERHINWMAAMQAKERICNDRWGWPE